MIEKLKPKLPYLAVVFLAYLVGSVFFPILGSEFLLLDVADQVLENPNIRGLTPKNLAHIFTSRCLTSYYPVRSLTFAVDYQIWGLNPMGFKLTNGLIHLTNVVLLFRLLLRLLRHPVSADTPAETWWDTAVALFFASIFAIHPVIVEPVAWVAGREELLLMLGLLGCIHCHLTARSMAEAPGRRPRAVLYHLGAAFFCALACLSNAVAVVIPLLVTAWDLLTLKRPILGRIIGGTWGLWLLGAVTVVIKILGPEARFAAQAAMPPAERLTLVLNLYWLNLQTLFWPTRLAFRYSEVTPRGFLDLGVILGAVAVCLTCLVFWIFRRRRLVAFGLIWFVLALAPSAQIMPHHIQRVDRFLCLPLMGLAIAMAAGVRPLRHRLNNRWASATVLAAAVSVLLVLDTLSVHQVRTWRNDVTVWENALRVSPHDAATHCSLADSLTAYGQFDLALQTYGEAMARHPGDARILVNFGWLLATCRDEQLRDYHRAIELSERGCKLDDWQNPAFRHSLATVYCSYAEDFTLRREFHPAADYHRRALAVEPDCQRALVQLAELLAFCNDPRLLDLGEAVRLAEKACQLAQNQDAAGLMLLARLYAESNRFPAALAATDKALQLAQSTADSEMLEQLLRQSETYRNRLPQRPLP